MIQKERYYALDVFRGVTVALMILVNNPGIYALGDIVGFARGILIKDITVAFSIGRCGPFKDD